jgi:O-antigen/teichoic acid export membrane protein
LLVLSYFNVGKQQIGWYAASFKIMEAFSALPSILGAALFPLMVQLRTNNPDLLNRLLSTTTKGVLLFSIPVAATISFFSRQIISLVYGANFAPGSGVLSVLIWCIVPMFLYFYLIFVNVAMGHAQYNMLAGCAALFAGLAANAVLVPKLGYIGAAWSALIANSSFALLATWKICTAFRKASIPPMLLKLFAAGILMVIAGLYSPAPMTIQFSLGLLAYVTVLISLGALSGEDVSLVVRMFQFKIQPVQEL